MKKILVLGAGFVAAPLVDFLHRHDYQMTVASHLLNESESLANRFEGVTAIQLDVSDQQALASVIRAHALVVSFVPYMFHELVAEVCIAERRSLVTASYETAGMRNLHQRAVEAGIIIVNEIGLDPGIDHLSAMKIFDEIHHNDEQLISFVSWCGGLPALSANDNPLGYKFSWSPRSVLLALLNDAKYISDGEMKVIPANQLLLNPETVTISDSLTLEGYPNRDSTTYVNSYSIPEAAKVLRGTLRYPGFCEIMQHCKAAGCFNQSEELISRWQNQPWIDYILSDSGATLQAFQKAQTEVQRDAFEYLDLFNNETVIQPSASILDSFCHLLINKLSYQKGESDMVVMQHQFESKTRTGELINRTSTLVLEGDPEGYSAMAKTVGTPAAIVVDMILSGELSKTGVVLPMTRDIYEPVLNKLATEKIELNERKYTNQAI